MSVTSDRSPLAIIGLSGRFPGACTPANLWANLCAEVDAINKVPAARFDASKYTDRQLQTRGMIRNGLGGFLCNDSCKCATIHEDPNNAANQQHSNDETHNSASTHPKSSPSERVGLFDAEFFRMSPLQASSVDPQQRLLLECAYETLEDAGIRLEQINGSSTAVMIGAFAFDYRELQLTSSSVQGSAANITSHTAMGVANCSLANRLSWQFNLTGPSLSVDTACSSSLVAIQLACEAIWNGQAEQAIAGGVNLILRPELSIAMSKGGFITPDGRCLSFSSLGAGYTRAEGVGLVMLKPLAAALRDGDRIHGTLLGIASNQDGHTPDGFTVPSAAAQAALAQRVQLAAGVQPRDIRYVECHGTGTSIGDPIEMSALGESIGRSRAADDPCIIGSIKSSIGHLEGAAGIAGFIKALFVAKHALVPRNLHALPLNAAIPFEKLRLQVATQQTSIKSCGDNKGPLYVAINSFGAGGTNAHAILQRYEQPLLIEESKEVEEASGNAHRTYSLLLSAKSPAALQSLASRWHSLLSRCNEEDVGALCFEAFHHRSALPQRLIVNGQNKAELVTALKIASEGGVKKHKQLVQWNESEKPVSAPNAIKSGEPAPAPRRRVAFMFSGQGGQWVGMGRDMFRNAPQSPFCRAVKALDELFAPIGGFSICERLLDPKLTEADLNRTVTAQVLTVAMQIGLHAEWQAAGIVADGYVGHSIGEMAAAHCSGAISLQQLATLIHGRSQLQQQLEGRGKMLAVGLPEERVRVLLHEQEERHGLAAGAGLEFAAINGPAMVSVVGDVPLLTELQTSLEASGAFAKFVQVEVPYHSRVMEDIREPFLIAAREITGKPVDTALYSTVTTQREPGTHINAKYWMDNIRQPVLFLQTIAKMYEDGFTDFIEVGPHPVLVRGTEEWIAMQQDKLPQQPGTITPTFVIHSTLRNRAERYDLAQNQLRFLNHTLHSWFPRASVNGFLEQESHRRMCQHLFGTNKSARHRLETMGLSLPRYPWQHKPYWLESPASREARVPTGLTHPLIDRNEALASSSVSEMKFWERYVHANSLSFAAMDHAVEGSAILPATAHMEIAMAVALQQQTQRTGATSNPFPLTLEDVHFDSALVIPTDTAPAVCVRLEVLSSDGDYMLHSRHTTNPMLPMETNVKKRQELAGASSSEAAWTKHSGGRMTLRDAAQKTESVVESPRRTPAEVRRMFEDLPLLDIKTFYNNCSSAGIPYGSEFQLIQRLQCHPAGYVLAQVALGAEQARTPVNAHYLLHPAVLDAALHSSFAMLHRAGDTSKLYLPHRVRRFVLHHPGAGCDNTQPLYALTKLVHQSRELMEIDCTLYNAQWQVVAEVSGLQSKYMVLTGLSGQKELSALSYEVQWRQAAEMLATVQQNVSMNRCIMLLADEHMRLLEEVKSELAQSNGICQVRGQSISALLAQSEWESHEQSPEAVSSNHRTALRQMLSNLNDGAKMDDSVHLVIALPSRTPPQMDESQQLQASAQQGQMAAYVAWMECVYLFAFDLLRVLQEDGHSARCYFVTSSRCVTLQGAAEESTTARVIVPLEHGSLFGMLRVAAHEQNTFASKIVCLPEVEETSTASEVATEIAQAADAECPAAAAAADAPVNWASLIARELSHWRTDCHEREVAYTICGMRLVREMVPTPTSIEESFVDRVYGSPVGHNFHAVVEEPGSIESVVLRRQAAYLQQLSPPCGPREVVIDVVCAGVNYKDPANAAGLLTARMVDGSLSGNKLGLEISGRIVEIGAEAEKHLKLGVGDGVIARAVYGFAGRVRADMTHVARKPETVGWAEAAALPVVWVTTLYGLEHLARLEEGETVLVHAGAGGVGVAAIKYAQMIGANVIATAGSESKRSWLKETFGLTHVFDSRSDFTSDVLRVTRTPACPAGGVDVVLSAMTGRAMEWSWACLAKFGRFVEIGKTDLYARKLMPLHTLAENISYFVVDADRLGVSKPALAHRLLLRTAELFEKGSVTPHPTLVMPIHQLHQALQVMLRGSVIGKLVIDMRGDSNNSFVKGLLSPNPRIPIRNAPFHQAVREEQLSSGPDLAVLPPLRYACSATGSYLITGGCSGFGLTLAEFLVQRGARFLVLVSRRGCHSEDEQTRVQALRNGGCTVWEHKADSSDVSAMLQLLDRFKLPETDSSNSNAEMFPALAGIIHAAGTVDDCLMSQMSVKQALTPFRVKATTAAILHCATARHHGLSLFLLISSSGSMCGLTGQLSYAAGNSFMDNLALARDHQPLALPGLSILCGLLGDYAGMSRSRLLEGNHSQLELRQQAHLFERMSSVQGIDHLAKHDILDRIEMALCQDMATRVDGNSIERRILGPGMRCIARVDWIKYSQSSPNLTNDVLYLNAGSNDGRARSRGDAALRSRLIDLTRHSAATAHAALVRALQCQFCKLLGLDVAQTDADAEDAPLPVSATEPIDSFGVDSLLLNLLRAWMMRELNVAFPMVKLLASPTIQSLATDLMQRLSSSEAASLEAAKSSLAAARSPKLQPRSVEQPVPLTKLPSAAVSGGKEIGAVLPILAESSKNTEPGKLGALVPASVLSDPAQLRHFLLHRICVQPPYFALDKISLRDFSNSEWLCSSFHADAVSAEAGGYGVAEMARHLAILGSCAVALTQLGSESSPGTPLRNYFPVKSAYQHERQELIHLPADALHTGKVYLRARPAREVEPGTATGRVAAADTMLVLGSMDGDDEGVVLMSMRIVYHVLPQKLFEQLFEAQMQRTPVVPVSTLAEEQLQSPYAHHVPLRITTPLRNGTVLDGQLPSPVTIEQCNGHFHNYPAFPVSIMSRHAVDLIIEAQRQSELLESNSLSSSSIPAPPKRSYWSMSGVCHTHRFIWAREEVTFRAERLSSPNPQRPRWRVNIYSREAGTHSEQLGKEAASFEFTLGCIDA